MQEKIKNFKDFGVIVVILSFIIIPPYFLLMYSKNITRATYKQC